MELESSSVEATSALPSSYVAHLEACSYYHLLSRSDFDLYSRDVLVLELVARHLQHPLQLRRRTNSPAPDQVTLERRPRLKSRRVVPRKPVIAPPTSHLPPNTCPRHKSRRVLVALPTSPHLPQNTRPLPLSHPALVKVVPVSFTQPHSLTSHSVLPCCRPSSSIAQASSQTRGCCPTCLPGRVR